MNSHRNGSGNRIASSLGENKKLFFGNAQPSLRQPQGRKACLMWNNNLEISPAQPRFGEQAFGKSGKNFRGNLEYTFAIHIK